MRRLKREWGGFALFAMLFLAAGFLVLRSAWASANAVAWLVVSAGITVYLFVYLWRHLPDNRLREPGAALFADLGLANRLTIVRAVFTAALAGFLMGPWPYGWLAWAPSTLYLVSSLMDFADGWAARITGRTTILGEALDMNWDGAGLLAASALAVLYGQAPVPYLLVGLARYLYLFGIWLRTRRGLPVYDLPPSRFRRPLAGAQMGFAAVVIMPVYFPPATHIAAALFMTPLLLGFLRDFLWVTGQIGRSAAATAPAVSPLLARFRESLPLVLRVLLLALLAGLIAWQVRQPVPAFGILLVAGLAIPALLLGIAGRVVALAVLLMSGFGLQVAPQEWRLWLILLASTLLFMTGTGRFSLWKPEEWLIDHRAGEVTK